MKQKALHANYRRIFTGILVAALLLAIVTAVGVPLSLRTQIREAHALEQAAQTQTVPAADGRHAREDDVWKGQLSPVPAANIVFYCALGALWAVLALWYWAEVVAWLYRAAVQANMNHALWPILGAFVNIFAVLAFLIVRARPARAAA